MFLCVILLLKSPAGCCTKVSPLCSPFLHPLPPMFCKCKVHQLSFTIGDARPAPGHFVCVIVAWMTDSWSRSCCNRTTSFWQAQLSLLSSFCFEGTSAGNPFFLGVTMVCRLEKTHQSDQSVACGPRSAGQIWIQKLTEKGQRCFVLGVTATISRC